MGGLIVHEWLEQHGGAEKVLDQMAKAFPTAPILSLWNDSPGRFEDGRVNETWLARTPLRRKKALALPIMPAVWKSQNTSEFDWVLCSSHLFAHHVKVDTKRTKKFVYTYTPARYIWNPELDGRGAGNLARMASPLLQRLDRSQAKTADSVVAISKFVRERIAKNWQVDSDVIYPPVEIDYFAGAAQELTESELELVATLPVGFILGASRFIPYKRLDLVITVGEAVRAPVVLAGGGPEEAALRRLAEGASVPVHFIQKPSQALLRYLYKAALCYVFPPVEDFGIMPVEAMAAGTPVIANAVGGAAETVIDGDSGALLQSFQSDEIRARFRDLQSISAEQCLRQASKFSTERFRSEIQELVSSEIV